MNVFAFSFRHSPGAVILALVTGILSGVCNTYVLTVINAGLNRQSAGSVAVLIWRLLSLCLVLAASRVVAEVVLARLGQRALYSLRMKLSAQILHTPLREIEVLGSSRFLEALTNDLPTVTNALMIIPLIGINVTVTACGLIYLGWLSFKLLSPVLVFLVIGVLIYQLPLIRAQHYLGKAREDGDALLKHFQGLIEGIKELKLHSSKRQDFMLTDLEPTAAALHTNSVRGLTIYSVAASLGQTLAFLVIGFMIFALPRFQQVRSSDAVAFALILLYLINPLQVIINALPALGRANVAIKQFRELEASLGSGLGEDATATAGLRSSDEWKELELRDVTYQYRSTSDTVFALGPLDLFLRRGELVFISGGNGSGKTTLGKLLTGLYVPHSGEICMDGRVINDQNRGWYREHFSAIFSDFFLFRKLFGIEQAQIDESVRDFLAQWDLDAEVKLQNREWSTVDLSRGQRKRLALMSTYLEDRPIFLFDEWAADQDPVFKRLFYCEFLPLLKSCGKTAIVITHDDRYFHTGDRLVRFEAGKIIEVCEPKNSYA